MFILFEFRKDMNPFLNKKIWSYLILRRDIWFSESDMPQKDKNSRSQYSYKLTGLKNNTAVEELNNLKEMLNIKALVIFKYKMSRRMIRKERFAIAYVEQK